MTEDGWQDIATAPRDGTEFQAVYDGDFSSPEDGVYWQEENRYCMLGPRAGSFPPGWSSAEVGLPVDPPTHWRPLPTPPNQGDG